MKNIIFTLLCLVLIVGIIFFLPKEKKQFVNSRPHVVISPIVTNVPVRKEKRSLFVPYWSLTKSITQDQPYDQFIYFGITPGQDGINTEEAGYIQLKRFVLEKPEAIETLLVLRMLEAKSNFAVLKDVRKQEVLIEQTIDITKKSGFAGVVLDLELSALPFDSLIKQVNDFAQRFSREAKAAHLSFSILLYGDTFYRIRPFEVKTLAGYTDQFMIMAYDFSKARGNPGPNFPLTGEKMYGYDYVKLTDNFLQVVPANKLSVIFGLYGYDWLVDDKNIAQNIGEARSLVEIQEQIIARCVVLQCETRRDNISAETMIHYIDEDGNKHVVWYEDMESVAAKQKYLKRRGITNLSFWANSYF